MVPWSLDSINHSRTPESLLPWLHYIIVQLQLCPYLPHHSPLPYPPPTSHIQSSLSLSLLAFGLLTMICLGVGLFASIIIGTLCFLDLHVYFLPCVGPLRGTAWDSRSFFHWLNPTGVCSQKFWGLTLLALEPWAGGAWCGAGTPGSWDNPPEFLSTIIGTLCFLDLHVYFFHQIRKVFFYYFFRQISNFLLSLLLLAPPWGEC